MGSENPLKLPLIDFSKRELKPGTPVWNSVKAQVFQALQEYGCFEASFTEIPSELWKAMIDALQELFQLPLRTKLRNVSKKPFRGYVGQYPMVPLYESMGIEDAPVLEKAESFTALLWPEGNPDFWSIFKRYPLVAFSATIAYWSLKVLNTVHSFSKQLSDLDQTIRRMVLESMSLEKYLDEHMESTNYLLRVMKYKGPQTTGTSDN
ncbi:hypothetical protein RJ639_047454 [Escallonia herrerae]|uniref:Non-haem dioxygenase N-terminal domain-containing protein n=1 Tax=Escallonia herrerae TaxID=1293975 RepID=A0AA88W5Z3_9ASTE|nr:hypothetical protein RJ639_047454 [Escallonia herrerae]